MVVLSSFRWLTPAAPPSASVLATLAASRRFASMLSPRLLQPRQTTATEMLSSARAAHIVHFRHRRHYAAANRDESVGPARHHGRAHCDQLFEQRYAELVAFGAEHGHVNVPRGHANRKLNVFVTTKREQRKRRDRGVSTWLTAEMIDRLDAIGFVWKTLTRQERWEQRFAELKAWVVESGNAPVPTEQRQLKNWCEQQRRTKKRFDADRPSDSKAWITAAAERIARLDSISFDWQPQAGRWEQQFAKLQRYEAEHGDCEVPVEWPPDPSLGSWVARQRSEWRKFQRGLPSTITHARITRLGGLDFSWWVKTGKKPPKQKLEEIAARSDPPSWARGYAELQREMEAEAEQETISEDSEGSPEVASLRMRS